MKQLFSLILVMLILLTACGVEKGFEVREAWIRPAAQGENGAVYFVIHNRGTNSDVLTGVSSDIAEAAEMHESRMSGDVMQMQQLDSVPLEASAEITFEPGGLHVMLVGLKKNLNVGDEIEITLHFTNFEDITVPVPVQEIPEHEEDH